MISKDTINTARATLSELPARERSRTTAQALAEMKAELLQAREKGYTDAEVCSQLAQLGIKASKATLRRALAPARSAAVRSKAASLRAGAAAPSSRARATDLSSGSTEG